MLSVRCRSASHNRPHTKPPPQRYKSETKRKKGVWMGVEYCGSGERRIERVFRLVAFIKTGFLFVLFSCGCNNLCLCVRLCFDKPVSYREKRFDYHIWRFSLVHHHVPLAPLSPAQNICIEDRWARDWEWIKKTHKSREKEGKGDGKEEGCSSEA